MRFAEHMLLEAKVHGLVAGMRQDLDDNRCALGLVEDRGTHKFGNAMITEVGKAENKYPWITGRASSPCPCCHYSYVNFIIAQVFNRHVMGDGTWTLEKLADWIESVDPTPRREVPADEPSAEVGSLVG